MNALLAIVSFRQKAPMHVVKMIYAKHTYEGSTQVID